MTFTWYCVHWRIWWENKEKNNCLRGITEKKKATKENSAFLSPNKDQLDNYLCTKIAIGDCKIYLGSFINAIKQTNRQNQNNCTEREGRQFLFAFIILSPNPASFSVKKELSSYTSSHQEKKSSISNQISSLSGHHRKILPWFLPQPDWQNWDVLS